MIYNTSFMNNATNILDLSVGIGTAMGNLFLIGNLLLFSFSMIFLVLGLKEDFMDMLLINMFLTTLLSVLMFMINFVSAVSIIVPFIILTLVLIFKMTLIK